MQLRNSRDDSQKHERLCPFHHRKLHFFDVDIIFSPEKYRENDAKRIIFCHVFVPWVVCPFHLAMLGIEQ